MRIPNLGKGWRIAGFCRLCIGIMVTLTLAAGGMALSTAPVQAAAFDIVAPFTFPGDNVSECRPFSIDHHFSTVGEACPNLPIGDSVYYWGDLATPSWVHIDSGTGVISGCADNGTAPGPYTFNIWASKHYATPVVSGCMPPGQAWWPSINSYAVTLHVGPQWPCISIVPVFVPTAWENVPFFVTLMVSGGTGIYNWSAAGLPVGLNLDPNTGTISGIPAPGTCGPWTVMVTCGDNGTCSGPGCCPPVVAPLYLYVDCWGNYSGMITPYATTACDFTVNIGPGLAYGATDVVVDGNPAATLAGNGSKTFTSVPCESHLVVVDQIVQGAQPKTRYACVGSNQKWVSNIDNTAYFDYAPDLWIDTAGEPAGVAQPPGAGFYAAGANFISSAPSPVQSNIQQGTKYFFRSWCLPDGSTNPNRDLLFVVDRAGTATAHYDTYYLLQLKSDSPYVVDESSWWPENANATWALALQPIPMPNFFGGIGGTLEPINNTGSHIMTGPYTQILEWQANWFWPIFWLVVTLLAIAAAIFFGLRGRKRGAAGTTGAATQIPTDATTSVKAAPTDTEKSLTESEAKGKPNFCPKCGNPVDKDAEFCKKCGNKLG